MKVSARATLWAAVALALGIGGLLATRAADEPKNPFASTTIDMGMVVGDLARSVKFYTEAIGFREGQGFSVPGDFCAAAGLTDSKALKIRVLTLGEGDSATKLKLMEVPGTKKSDNAFIHSQLGLRYLTVFVADLDAALARLKTSGANPALKGPMALPAGLPAGLGLAVVRDPDGNPVELIGRWGGGGK